MAKNFKYGRDRFDLLQRFNFGMDGGGLFGGYAPMTFGDTGDPESAPTTMQSSVSQYGITWTFDQPYPVGQYCTGDYFVVGPVTITEIDPVSTDDGTRVMNGSMVNPGGGTPSGGFDSHADGYSHDLNVAWAISEQSPLHLQAGDSLVSSRSYDTPPRLVEFLVTLAVLTVVDQIPSSDSFRPPYAGSEKTMRYTVADVRTARLTNLPVVGSPPSWADMEKLVERPFIDFVPHWTKGYVHGNTLNNEHYGRDVSRLVGAVSLMLLSDYPLDTKLPTLIGLIQRGIDLWGIYEDAIANGRPFPWEADGGHNSGRKWPILFAGYLLDDQEMLNVGSIPEEFHEDRMTLYVQQWQVDVTQGGMSQVMKDNIAGTQKWEDFQTSYPDIAARTGDWFTDHRAEGFMPYFENMIGLPEWWGTGWFGSVNPNAHWSYPYRVLNYMNWKGITLSPLILGLKVAWNNNALFDYQHRAMEMSLGRDDPFAVHLGAPRADGADEYSIASGGDTDEWQLAMWNAYWPMYYSMDDWLEMVGP